MIVVTQRILPPGQSQPDLATLAGAGGPALRGWPHAVAIAIAVAILVQAGALVAWCRWYAATGKGTPEGFAR
jgi:hypothetical protein